MPKMILRQSALITALTFLFWLGCAILYPDDRLNVKETSFVWIVIGVSLLIIHWIRKFISRDKLLG